MGEYLLFWGEEKPYLYSNYLPTRRIQWNLEKELEGSCSPSSPLFPFPLSLRVVIFCCLHHHHKLSAFGPFSLTASESS